MVLLWLLLCVAMFLLGGCYRVALALIVVAMVWLGGC